MNDERHFKRVPSKYEIKRCDFSNGFERKNKSVKPLFEFFGSTK